MEISCHVYHETVYADNVVSKVWFVRCFSSQHHSKVFGDVAIQNVSQVCTKKCKARSFTYKLSLNFLRSSRHFNCDNVFAVVVPFLQESVHGFNKIGNGSVATGFQIAKFRQLSKFLNQKS